MAERKRKEERERVKERLQRQREDDKKKRVVGKVRSRGDDEQQQKQQSSQSGAGEDENGEWYHQDVEEGSIRFSSSFSSTASLLEHVRSLAGWSSDNTSLQEQTVAEEDESLREDKQHNGIEARPQWCNEGRGKSHLTSELESSTLDEASGTEKGQKNSRFKTKPSPKQPTNETRGRDLLQVPSGKTQKQQKKKKVQIESRSPQLNGGFKSKQQKAKSLLREHQPMSKYESSTPKMVATQHHRLNNESRGAQSPTTGLQSVLKANQTRGMLPHKQTNQIVRSRITPTAKAATKHQHQKVPLNDIAASPVTRRVASSDTLLDHPNHNQQSHNKPANHPKSTAATRLANTPSKVRKSIGYMGEFETQASIYDLLEKKPEKKRRAKRDDRLEKGFQTPTFDPRPRPDDDPELQVLTLLSPHSNSQPENFDFISNPSYESRAEAEQRGRNTAQAKAKSQSLGRYGPATNQNGHSATNTGGVHQSYIPASKMPKAVVVNTGAPHNSRLYPGSSRGWQNSESDSSETGRVRSVLSDHSSVTQSSLTHQSILSGHQSNSSGGFSSGSRSEAASTGIKLHSNMTSRPLPQSILPHPSHGELIHSGLPTPRKQYNSHPRGEAETNHSRHNVAPHPPPHRPTTRVPMGEGALTSYPRFQRREDHRARMEMGNQPTSRRHRTKQQQLGVLPGTGQLAQVSKPHPDHAHLLHQAKNSSRHPDRAGSLV